LEALGINLGYLISQIVNFTLLALLLYVVAYKPILRMLDARSARIQKGLEDAEAASRRAAQMEQEFEQRLAEARREGQEIIAQATQISEKARQEILDRAREEASGLIDKARDEIDPRARPGHGRVAPAGGRPVPGHLRKGDRRDAG
jgi:F-type H+-transporting ATPase subunit b